MHGKPKLILVRHQVTSDLKTWGPVVNDVAYDAFAARPGMTTIAYLPNGQYIITYEYCNSPQGGCVIYYRLSSSPLTFNAAAPGTFIEATTGEVPSSSPNVAWTPAGGVNGTIIFSANSLSEKSKTPDKASQSLTVL
jgi:hypothetical protein